MSVGTALATLGWFGVRIGHSIDVLAINRLISVKSLALKSTFVSDFALGTYDEKKSFRSCINNVISDAATKAFGEQLDSASDFADKSKH